ncbi:hypothetical protein FQN53_005346 [Emmonsiellopsis sp. PD_33]|nr:hypothetical protein FQN53_005346 [Emmonsiellopsis sp. PD_33]
MSSHLRDTTRCSPGLMPIFALGHIVPAIGAIRTATGSYQYPVAVLGMIALTMGLVDAHDSYRDVSPTNRPRNRAWKVWMYSLTIAWLLCIVFSGLQTAIQTQRFLLIGMCWQVPCIPLFSVQKFRLCKPKTVLGEAKSLFVAICMGYFTADAAMFHYCHDKTASCSQQSLRTRSLCLVILYHFFRETVNDARDIAEDSRDGLKTLPMKLGKRNTFIIMAASGLPLDMMLTAGLWATQGGVWVNPRLVLEGGLRICLTMAAYWKILQYPRKNVWAWGAMGLLGLTPVLWAQASLLDGYRVMGRQ